MRRCLPAVFRMVWFLQLRLNRVAMTIAHGIARNLTPAMANNWPESKALNDEGKAWISI